MTGKVNINVLKSSFAFTINPYSNYDLALHECCMHTVGDDSYFWQNGKPFFNTSFKSLLLHYLEHVSAVATAVVSPVKDMMHIHVNTILPVLGSLSTLPFPSVGSTGDSS